MDGLADVKAKLGNDPFVDENSVRGSAEFL